MKVLGVIPARFASSRFPGKPLIDLKGKSMIQRVYEGASMSKRIDKVIVATDDQRIYKHVQDFGGEVEMTDNNHKTGTERCGEILCKYDNYDVLINIQGDEPLVSPVQLNTLIDLFDNKSVNIGTLGIKGMTYAESKDPNRIKIVLNHLNEAIYFSRSVIPFNQKDEDIGEYFRHIGLYAFRTEVLKELVTLSSVAIEKAESLEQLRWLYFGYKINIALTNIETPNIDVPEDVNTVLKLISD